MGAFGQEASINIRIGTMNSQDGAHLKQKVGSRSDPHLLGFRVRAKLGRGTWSNIFQVEDPSTGQMYALKHVRLPAHGDLRVLARAKEEWDIGSQLTHPVLRRYVRLLPESNGTGHVTGHVTGYGLLTEFFDCPMLSRVMFDFSDTLDILRRVACALDSMHSAGFVHGALRPGCLYVSVLGRVRLGGVGDATVNGKVKPLRSGSPGYLAPEIVRGQAVTPATDAFLFASTAYTLFLDKFHPAAIRSDPIAAKQIPPELFGIDAPIKELIPSIPDALAQFINQALHSEPSERPQLHDLLDELQWHDRQQESACKPLDAPSPITPVALKQHCPRNPRTPQARRTCGAQRETLHSHAFGYRILRWLGDGAWSRVYLAEHTATQTCVALKHVHAVNAREDHHLASVRNEWERCRNFTHPNLRRAHALLHVGESLESARILALVMEALDCTPLLETQLDPSLAFGVLRDTASALTYIHSHGFIHANVKPQSVFVSCGRTTKLAGLGQMIPVDATVDNTRIQLGYTAPEMLKRQALSDKVDVFALASMSVLLLTGKFAPEAAEVLVGGQGIPHDEIGSDLPLHQQILEVSSDFSRLVQKSLASNPSQRPTMAELADALK